MIGDTSITGPRTTTVDLVEAAVAQRRLDERRHAAIDGLDVGLDRRALAAHVHAVVAEPLRRAACASSSVSASRSAGS